MLSQGHAQTKETAWRLWASYPITDGSCLSRYLHELQSELRKVFGVTVNCATICKTLKFTGCTRQCMHHVALKWSDTLRAQFMATVSMCDPSMLVWLDESGHDRRHTIRKQAYSFRGMPLANHLILARLGVSDILQFPSCLWKASMFYNRGHCWWG